MRWILLGLAALAACGSDLPPAFTCEAPAPYPRGPLGPPELLAPEGSFSMVVGSERIFWTVSEGGSQVKIRALPRAGGTPVDLGTVSLAAAMTVGGDTLYVSELYDDNGDVLQRLHAFPPGEGTHTVLPYAGPAIVRNLVFACGTLFGGLNEPRVVAVDLDGSAQFMNVSRGPDDQIWDLHFDGDSLFTLALAFPAKIVRFPLDGSAASVVATIEEGSHGWMVSDRERLTYCGSGFGARCFTIPVTGGTPTDWLVAMSGETFYGGYPVAIDADSIYFTGDLGLYKVPKEGGGAILLSGIGHVGAIAARDDGVYFAGSEGIFVMRRQ